MSQEQAAYKSISEAAKEIGIKRPTMYHYINILGIKTKKFNFSREKYISAEDVERIKEVRQKPWLAGEKSVKEDASAALACSVA
jgi:hypothetical protein